MNEQEFLAVFTAAKNGCEISCEKLEALFMKKIMYFSQRMKTDGNMECDEDLYQEQRIRFLMCIRDYKVAPDDNYNIFRAYCNKAFVNKRISYNKEEIERENLIYTSGEYETEDVEDSTGSEHSRLEDVIPTDLTEKETNLVILLDRGYKLKEIAVILSTTEAAIKKCRERLKKKFKNIYE